MSSLIEKYLPIEDVYSIGEYYYKNKDYKNMLKYYLLAVEFLYSTAMIKLGNYYHDMKDYENITN